MKTLFCLVLFAQWQPMLPPQQPKVNPRDPHVRRQWREDAVRHVGDAARPFVEKHEFAARALLACRFEVAWNLTAAFNNGDLAKLPSLDNLLVAIALCKDGNAVAAFSLGHLKELEGIDVFNAYLSNPLEYSLNLRDLSAGTLEAREKRLNREMYSTPFGDSRVVLFWTLVFGVVGFLIWRRVRRRDDDSMVV